MPDRGSLTPAPAVRDHTTTSEKEQTDGAPLRQSSLTQIGELQEMETENQKVIDETNGDTSRTPSEEFGKNSIRSKRRSSLHSVSRKSVSDMTISRSEEEKQRDVQQEDDEYHQ